MKHKQEVLDANIVNIAKAIGKGAVKIAVLAGVEQGDDYKPPARNRKLPRRNKHRLPRPVNKAHSRRAAHQFPAAN